MTGADVRVLQFKTTEDGRNTEVDHLL